MNASTSATNTSVDRYFNRAFHPNVIHGEISVREYLVDKIERTILDVLESLHHRRLLVGEHGLCNRFSLNSGRSRRMALDGHFKSFARYLSVLEIVYNAIIQDATITKRHIYYQDVELFGSQRAVDEPFKIIENICHQYSVPRHNLNISASCKGMISGPISIFLKNGSVLRCGHTPIFNLQNTSDQVMDLGVPIPFEGSIQHIQCEATDVLVVEKETIFQWLLTNNFKKRFWNCLLVTGKGYPDVATRYLLNMISTANRCCAMSNMANRTIKIWSLMDGDPHGIDIHVVYKWGGRCHHNEILTCPDIQWLGIHSQDIKSFPISNRCKIPMKVADRKKAIATISHLRLIVSETSRNLPPLNQSYYHAQYLMREMSYILHQNVKYELEALSSIDNRGLISYLQSKLWQQQV